MKLKNKGISKIYDSNGYVAFFFLLAFSIIFLLLEIYNGRFWQSDFTVYYKAAQRLLEGNTLFRHVEDGHYIFKYSPVSALYFIPFTVFSLNTAKILYWFFLTGIIIGSYYISVFLVSKGEVFKNPRRLNNIILLGALILVVHFQRELHLGQVNQLLLLLYLLAAYCFGRNKPILSSLLLALSIFLKPFAIIFLPYLIVKKRYKETSYFVLFGVILFFLPLFFYSFDEFVNQNILWVNELTAELEHKQGMLQSANHTIFSIFARFTPLRLISFTPAIIKIYQVILLGLMAASILVFIRKGKNIENNYVSEFALLICLIPLLSFTSQNAFGFAALMVFILLLNFSSFSLSEKIVTTIGFVFLGGNYNDVWGSELSGLFNDISLVSFGSLILIVVLFRKRFQKVL